MLSCNGYALPVLWFLPGSERDWMSPVLPSFAEMRRACRFWKVWENRWGDAMMG